MTYFHISIPFLASCLCFCIFYTQARLEHHHHHQHHDHHNHHDHENKHKHHSPSPSNAPYTCDVDGDGIFDVRKFGAIGDGLEDDTNAFKEAWKCACQSQSQSPFYLPMLLVPHGYYFIIQSTIFKGPCKSPIIFQVDGTLMPPDGPESWPKNKRHKWLVFYRINQMIIKGRGLIDGRGQQWWDLPCKPHKGPNGSTLPGPCDSPSAIRFVMCANLKLQELKIKDSPHFNVRFDRCVSVRIDSIFISAPASSPNTDGIHIENTNDVQIHNSIISNGDDCVSIGSGCYDVDIKNITCVHGHGISIGSLGNQNSWAWVSNITVRDSTITRTKNGVRIKTWQGGYGAVNHVKYENILMENVRNPIIIDQFYCPRKRCLNQTSAVVVSNIEYKNIKGTYNVRSSPVHFACSDSVPCRYISLSEVELFPVEGHAMLDAFCWNVYGEIETMTIPPVYCLLDGRND
ncbi:polygalacturonase At1g48100 [Helianthus annuus]|nr:polygalacturonase At1g48100 [Helianthus annuus]